MYNVCGFVISVLVGFLIFEFINVRVGPCITKAGIEIIEPEVVKISQVW